MKRVKDIQNIIVKRGRYYHSDIIHISEIKQYLCSFSQGSSPQDLSLRDSQLWGLLFWIFLLF